MPLRDMHFDTTRIRAIFYLLVVPLLIVAVLVLGIRNQRLNNERALRQSQINRVQIAGLKRADAQIRRALFEVCHGQTVEYGILLGVIAYFQEQYGLHPTLAVRVVVETLQGYARDLGQRSACETIRNP